MTKTSAFKGDLGNYQIITTEDNSITLWSEFFDENCHSLAGAVEETTHNYIRPTNLINRAKTHHPLVILEIGFGLGIGINTAFQALDDIEGIEITMISLELDEALILWTKENNNTNFKQLPSLNDLSPLEIAGIKCYQAKKGNNKLYVAIGDARKTLLTLHREGITDGVNAIFQDPFSPKKNTSLWTVEWFEDLKKVSSKDVILSTYSASSSVKKGLYQAGWIPKHRDGFKGKRQSISATLTGVLSSEMTDHLKRSPAVPFRD